MSKLKLTAGQKKGNAIAAFFGWLLFFHFLRSVLRVTLNSFYGLLVYAAIILFFGLLVIRYKRFSVEPKIKSVRQAAFLSAGAALLIMTVVTPSVCFLIRVLDWTGESQSQPTLWLTLLFTCCITPVTEEFSYRMILQGRLRQDFSPYVAILLPAMFFGLAHGVVVRIIPMIFVGIVLGYIYEMTGKIRYTIMIHVVYNIFSVFFVPKFMINSVAINIIGFFLGLISSVILIMFCDKQPIGSKSKS